jgi:hypothetical protein
MDDRFTLDQDESHSLSPDGQEPEAFLSVPQSFLAGLSPERFLAIQQLYETAFEIARQKIARQDEEVD